MLSFIGARRNKYSMRGTWPSSHPSIHSFYLSIYLPTHLSLCERAQLCPTLCHPKDYSPPGFSSHGIFQARVLEWDAIAFSEH